MRDVGVHDRVVDLPARQVDRDPVVDSIESDIVLRIEPSRQDFNQRERLGKLVVGPRLIHGNRNHFAGTTVGLHCYPYRHFGLIENATSLPATTPQ